jgi:O-methyltransferase
MCLHRRMSRLQRINANLGRMTGYQIRRAPRPKLGGQSAPKAGPPAPPPSQPAPAPAAAPAPAPAPSQAAPKQEHIPRDFDAGMAEIIRAVRPYTMTSVDKLHALVSATRYVARYKIPGDIVECGVWRGGSMHAVARTLAAAGDRSRDLYLYDTFEGMTEPTEKDLRWDGMRAAEGLERSRPRKETSALWAYASLEDVQAGFAEVPYPKERLHFIKGPVEETVPGVLPEQIAILRLDTDWYESTAHELKHMYDRLVPGGVLLLDDYAHWQGAREATDEWLDASGEPLLLLRAGGGRVAVKLGLPG